MGTLIKEGSTIYLQLPHERERRKLGELGSGVFLTYRKPVSNTLSKFSKQGEIGFNADLIDHPLLQFKRVIVRRGREHLTILRETIKLQRRQTFNLYETQYFVPIEEFQKKGR